MFILTGNDDIIISISTKLEYQSNGNPLVKDRNGFEYAIAKAPDEQINVYEMEEIPDKVEENKYCYTKENGFYKNPNYVRTYTIEERLEALEAIILEEIMS